jgi:hypothetical protein
MSLSNLKNQLVGLDLAIQTLTTKRDSILSQIRIQEKPKGKPIIKSKDPEFEKNLKLLRIGVTALKKPNKLVPKVPADLTLEQLGRQGEIAFWNYLHEILDTKVCSINWVNKMNETRKPFDFIITICGVEIYIDVKCTRSNFKQQLFLSSQERLFAASNSDRYFVARLYQFDSKADKRYKADSFNVKLLTYDQTIKQFKLK